MSETDAYLTIAEPSSARFAVRDSTFIAHAAPTKTTEAAEEFIAELKNEYAEATHNVPAYRVRADPFREYASDEGEPSGSAGKPILSVLRGEELENVCVVVTRYYGGTKLGVGGLIKAYSKATKEALEEKTVERRPRRRLEATVEYDDSGTVRGILESEGVDFEADYGECVVFEVSVPVVDADAVVDRLRSATSDRIELGSESDKTFV